MSIRLYNLLSLIFCIGSFIDIISGAIDRAIAFGVLAIALTLFDQSG